MRKVVGSVRKSMTHDYLQYLFLGVSIRERACTGYRQLEEEQYVVIKAACVYICYVKQQMLLFGWE